MKKTIALGLALLALWSALPPGQSNRIRRVASEALPEPASLPRITKAASAGPEAWRAFPEPARAQTAHGVLLEAIETQIDEDRRGELLEHLVATVSDADLPAMLDALMRDPSPGRVDELRRLLVRRWAENDARAAAAWAAHSSEHAGSRDALVQVAIAWAGADFPAAAQWVQTLPEGGGRDAAALALAYEACRTDPVAAVEAARTLPATHERDELLVHAVNQWTGTDFTNAATWSGSVADPSLRHRLVASVAVVLAETDASAAAALALDHIPAGEQLDRALVSIVQRWVQHAPEAAASWISHIPDVPSREPAVQNLLAIWIDRDAEAAGVWLSGLPSGPLREAALTAYDRARPGQAAVWQR